MGFNFTRWKMVSLWCVKWHRQWDPNIQGGTDKDILVQFLIFCCLLYYTCTRFHHQFLQVLPLNLVMYFDILFSVLIITCIHLTSHFWKCYWNLLTNHHWYAFISSKSSQKAQKENIHMNLTAILFSCPCWYYNILGKSGHKFLWVIIYLTPIKWMRLYIMYCS